MMDIIQNSIAAGAGNISISVNADRTGDLLSMEISDDGCGMDPVMLSKVTDPFTTTRTTRKVGLGLPLFKEACETAGGRFVIHSALGTGTRVVAEMAISDMDRLPLGDFGDTYFVLMLNNDRINYFLEFKAADRIFSLDISTEKKRRAELGSNEFETALYIRDLIEEEKKVIFGGILNEIAR
ncbi:MAG: ATP-binding protein [Saccharofermentanales bacterium]